MTKLTACGSIMMFNNCPGITKKVFTFSHVKTQVYNFHSRIGQPPVRCFV